MAESILKQLGQGRFRAFSAGSHPTGRVNALAMEQLAMRGYPTHGLASKSWDAFLVPGSPVMDFVITVCAHAGREKQPLWPGNPQLLFWTFPDPGAVQGTDLAIRQSFSEVCDGIEQTLKQFLEHNDVSVYPTVPLENRAVA